MKSQTLQSIKFARLQTALDTAFKTDVTGLLEMLWQFTTANAITGAVGRFSDADICAWMGCRMHGKTPEQLIQILVDTGFLDRHDEHRIVVHDWHEHCPTFIRGTMASHGRLFANIPPDHEKQPVAKSSSAYLKAGAKAASKAASKAAPKTCSEASPQIPSYHGSTKPNLTKPNQTSPSPGGGGDDGSALTGANWAAVQARLIELGVAKANEVMVELRQAGLSPEYALAVITHFESNRGAWEVGMLVWRLRNGLELSPTEGWPRGKETIRAQEQAQQKVADIRKAIADDTSFRELVKAGRKRGATDEEILAVADQQGLGDAAARAGWRSSSQSTQSAQST